MTPQQTTRRRVTDERLGTDAVPSPSAETETSGGDADRRTLNSEDVYVRSYAHRQTHELDLEVLGADGTVALAETYALDPGAVKSEINALPAGTYEVRAVLDGDRRETRPCRVDGSPAGTIVIEIGNCVLSLSEGLCY